MGQQVNISQMGGRRPFCGYGILDVQTPNGAEGGWRSLLSPQRHLRNINFDERIDAYIARFQRREM
jgi:hypothetical protein